MTEPPRPPPLISLTADYAAAVLSAVVLTVVAMQSSVVDSMDLLRVSEEASAGSNWSGQKSSLLPLFLWCTKLVVGDALWAGKALTVMSGVTCVVFSTRMFGPWAGLWVLSQLGFLVSVQQADPGLIGISFLWISMSFSARGKSLWAGIWGAIAVGCASWLWPFIIGVVWFSRRFSMTILGLGVGVGGLNLMNVSFLPDVQLPNPARLEGLLVESASVDWLLGVGAVAILWGALRRNRGSRSLAILIFMGLVGSISIPDTPSSLLPLQLCFALGVAAVEAGPALLVASLVILGLRLPDVLDVQDQDSDRRMVIEAMRGRAGEVLCTTPTIVRRGAEGWLRGCVGLEVFGLPATSIYPHHVRTYARRMNIRWLAIEDRKVMLDYPWLQDLLAPPYPDGFSVLVDSGGWRVFNLQAQTDRRREP